MKKILIVLMIGCFLLGMATKAETEVAKEIVEDSATTKSDKGYRIEVGKTKLRGEEEEIRFISPEGNVMRTINKYHYKTSISETKGQWNTEINHVEAISGKKNAVLLWKCNYSTNYNPQGKEGPHGSERDYEVKVLNSRGEESLVKNFTVYPTGYLAIPFWSTGISKDGSTIYVYYRDSSDVFHVEVYDTDGSKLAEASNENYLDDLQISPDGKIVGAETEKKVGKAWLRHLFFLDVETGETKVVKAEGKGWRVSGFPLRDKKIELVLHEYPKSYTMSFNQFPNDLSNLFGD